MIEQGKNSPIWLKVKDKVESIPGIVKRLKNKEELNNGCASPDDKIKN